MENTRKGNVREEASTAGQAIGCERMEDALREYVKCSSAMPGLEKRTMLALERRALAKKWMAENPDAIRRVFSPKNRTALTAVVRGAKREISGSTLALFHVVNSPTWRVAGACIIGAVSGYSSGYTVGGLSPMFKGAVELSTAHIAYGLSIICALAGVLAVQVKQVQGYVR